MRHAPMTVHLTIQPTEVRPRLRAASGSLTSTEASTRLPSLA